MIVLLVGMIVLVGLVKKNGGLWLGLVFILWVWLV